MGVFRCGDCLVYANVGLQNGQYEIGGAEEPMAFLGVFDEIKEQSGRNVTSNGGETC